jgi:hypothetical protein
MGDFFTDTYANIGITSGTYTNVGTWPSDKANYNGDKGNEYPDANTYPGGSRTTNRRRPKPFIRNSGERQDANRAFNMLSSTEQNILQNIYLSLYNYGRTITNKNTAKAETVAERASDAIKQLLNLNIRKGKRQEAFTAYLTSINTPSITEAEANALLTNEGNQRRRETAIYTDKIQRAIAAIQPIITNVAKTAEQEALNAEIRDIIDNDVAPGPENTFMCLVRNCSLVNGAYTCDPPNTAANCFNKQTSPNNFIKRSRVKQLLIRSQSEFNDATTEAAAAAATIAEATARATAAETDLAARTTELRNATERADTAAARVTELEGAARTSGTALAAAQEAAALADAARQEASARADASIATSTTMTQRVNILLAAYKKLLKIIKAELVRVEGQLKNKKTGRMMSYAPDTVNITQLTAFKEAINGFITNADTGAYTPDSANQLTEQLTQIYQALKRIQEDENAKINSRGPLPANIGERESLLTNEQLRTELSGGRRKTRRRKISKRKQTKKRIHKRK